MRFVAAYCGRQARGQDLRQRPRNLKQFFFFSRGPLPLLCRSFVFFSLQTAASIENAVLVDIVQTAKQSDAGDATAVPDQRGRPLFLYRDKRKQPIPFFRRAGTPSPETWPFFDVTLDSALSVHALVLRRCLTTLSTMDSMPWARRRRRRRRLSSFPSTRVEEKKSQDIDRVLLPVRAPVL